MSSYKADLQQILDLITAAEATGRRVDAQLASINSKVAALVIHWEGTAQAKHEAKHEAWMKAAEDMRLALTELKTNVAHARQVYSDNVAHNVRMWP